MYTTKEASSTSVRGTGKRLVPANPYQVTVIADDPNVPIPAQTTLRDAIGAALGAGGGVTVTFAQGLSGTIQLQAALPTINQSITIANTTGNGVTVAGSGPNAPNTYRVFTIGSGTTCEIDNLTISNGYGANGGGVYNSGTLTLKNDNVVNNSTPNGGNGGGIFNTKGTVTLVSTNVNNNQIAPQGGQGALGGGIYNAGSGTLNISGSSELDNNRASNGGGIFNRSGCLLFIKNGATIDYNTVTGGGGGVDNSFGSVNITGSTIYENFGSIGGGIYTVGGKVTLTDCYIFSNGARTGNGGGILMNGGTMLIWGGTLQGNIANNGNGGGIYLMSGSLTLNGGVLIGSGNSAINGGGIYLLDGSNTTFSNCTVSGNKATGKGVGVAYHNGAPKILFNGLTDDDDPGGQPVQV